jgi:shikimate kinase
VVRASRAARRDQPSYIAAVRARSCRWPWLPTYAASMARVLLTGMSGAGKSTLLAAVARRGYRAIDTDYDGWELADAQWDEPRMSALLAEHPTIAVSGTARNQRRFYDRFEHVVYLYVPLHLLLDRTRTRTNNPYGKTAEQQADITRYVAEVEPLIRWSATLELDGLLPTQALAERIEQCLRSS